MVARPTRWEPLSEVTWTSPPLGSMEYTRRLLHERFGEAQLRDLDSNGIGLFDAWLLRFDCGLEVALWIFHQRPDASVVDGPDELAMVEFHANEVTRGHILFHLGLDREDVSLWEPDPGVDEPATWEVRRLDDNANEFEVARVQSRCEAEAMAAEMEGRGHKQTYWVAPLER